MIFVQLLFTFDWRVLLVTWLLVTNQNLVDNTQGLLTESGLEFITQDGRSILVNPKTIVPTFPGLLTESGLEFITQDGRSILTNAPD